MTERDEHVITPAPAPPGRRGSLARLLSAMVGAGTAVAAIGTAARRNDGGTKNSGKSTQGDGQRDHNRGDRSDRQQARADRADRQAARQERHDQHDRGNHHQHANDSGGDHRHHADLQPAAKATATATSTPTGGGGGGGHGGGGGGGGGGGNSSTHDNPFLDHLGNRAQSLATKAERMAGHGNGNGSDSSGGGKTSVGPDDTTVGTRNITLVQGPKGTTIETGNISFHAPAPTSVPGVKAPRGQGTPGAGNDSGGGTTAPVS